MIYFNRRTGIALLFSRDKTLIKSLLLYIGMVAVVLCGSSYGAETVVLEAGDRDLRFRINIPDNPAELFEETGPDSTVLLYATTLIGLPPGGDAEIVSAVGLEPKVVITSGSNTNIPSTSLARLLRPFSVRGREFSALRVYPVVGNTMYGAVEITVRFTGGQPVSGSFSSDPIIEKLSRAVVVNHQQMKQWPKARKPSRKVSSTGPFGLTSDWYKIKVNRSGLYKVTGAQLRSAGLILGSISSDHLHLFNAGGRQLEVPNDRPRPDFQEVAIIVEDGGDGSFDNQDYFLFYGEALNRWWYRPNDSVGYYKHHYDTDNVYWFTASESIGSSGRRMFAVNGAPNGLEDTVFTTYRRYVHSEQDTLLSKDNSGHIRDYYRWYASDAMSQSIYISANDVVAGEIAEVRIVADLPWSTDSYSLKVAGDPASKISCDDSSCTFAVNSLREGLNRFSIDFSIGGTHRPFLDYIELGYFAELAPRSDRLDFYLAPYDGRASIELIDNFSSEPIILDLADPRKPVRVQGFSRGGGLVTIGIDMTLNRIAHYYASTIERVLAPQSIEQRSPTDLRSGNTQADLIIITPEVFSDAMQEYIDYREADGWSVRIITTEDIYDNFSYGLFDPVAIRDFLKYAYETWPEPSPAMVLLVGDGNYDYLNIMGHDAPNYVPPLIHEYDKAFAYSDDNYVYFGDYGFLDGDTSYNEGADRGLDMLTARWTVRNTSEIQHITSKTKRYESPTNFGLWRTTVTLVADDEFAGQRTSELIHTGQIDTLGMFFLPSLYTRDKIYAIEFPFVNDRKPGVNDAIVNAINDGRLVVNYVGHGNPGLWAHERIFTVADDLPRLNNYDRLPLVIAASCAIGFYDEPEGAAMAEELLTHTSGGAIAIISATRLVWSSPYKRFNQTLFDVLFSGEDLTICEAMFTTKMLHQLWAGGPTTQTNNDRAFIFLGDPLLNLARPRLHVDYTSSPDSLVALQPVTVSGEIVDDAGNPVSGNGLLDIRVFDSDQQKHYVSSEYGGTGGVLDYAVDGAAIFRGSAPVVDGRFSFEFVPPLDIGFGGERARIMGYASLDSVDAADIVDSIYVAESLAEITDTTGPQIRYGLAGRDDFVDGDPIQPGDIILITLSDPSGINLAGGLGHGISLEIDGQSDRVMNLTGEFEYFTGDFTSGSVEFTPDSLEPGRHRFKIKAWDNANNSATVEFTAELAAADGPVISDLLNYPNPMRETTRFSFYALRGLESFSIEIFTLSGRKIKSYSQNSLLPGYHDEFEWRGEDSGGDRVATGVYIYKATARPQDGREEVELFGKVVVIN